MLRDGYIFPSVTPPTQYSSPLGSFFTGNVCHSSITSGRGGPGAATGHRTRRDSRPLTAALGADCRAAHSHIIIRGGARGSIAEARRCGAAHANATQNPPLSGPTFWRAEPGCVWMPNIHDQDEPRDIQRAAPLDRDPRRTLLTCCARRRHVPSSRAARLVAPSPASAGLLPRGSAHQDCSVGA